MEHDAAVIDGVIDENTLDSTAQEPISISPDLADRYVEVARFIASIPEKDAITMFIPAEDDPRLDELRQFLSFIFLGWRTTAPFYFFPKMREEIRELHRHNHHDGTFPEILFGRRTSHRDWTGRGMMPSRFYCDYTSCGRGKNGGFPSLRRQMGKLLLLNALGWDIYGCPNPILYRNRMQRTMPWIVNLVVESDEATLEEQEESVSRMAGKVGAVVFSGRRSLHQYYRLAAPIRNPHAITPEQLDRLIPRGSQTGGMPWTRWHLVMTMKRTNQLSPVPVEPFRYASDLLRGFILEKSGLQICPATLLNFSCLSRVPGFVHTGSGERSRLISLNKDAVWCTNSLGEPDDVRYSPFWRQLLGISSEDVFPPRHRKQSVSPMVSCNGVSDPGISEPERRSGTEDGTERGTQDGNEDPALASVPYKGLPPAIPTGTKGVTLAAVPPGRTFLDELDDFESLKSNGIQCRGIRRSLHKVMVNVALLRGWTKLVDRSGGKVVLDQDRIRDEWRTILSLSGHSIGCSIDDGLDEMDGYVEVKNRKRSDGRFRFAMPDCTRLPDMDAQLRKHLRKGIQRLVAGEMAHHASPPTATPCPMKSVVTGIANIIADVLYPKLKALPAQCQVGKLSLPTKDMRFKCPRSNFPPVREWMYRLNVIRPTRGANHSAGLTRLYWVNIPLVIWLMGFRKGDLAWDRHVGPGAAGDDVQPREESHEGQDRKDKERDEMSGLDTVGTPHYKI